MIFILILIAVLACFLCYTSTKKHYPLNIDGGDFDESDEEFFAIGADEDEHRVLKVDPDTWEHIDKKTKDARGGTLEKFEALKTISYYSKDRNDVVKFNVVNKRHYNTMSEFIVEELAKTPKAFFPSVKKKEDAITLFGQFYKESRLAKMGGIVVLDLEREG